MNLLKVILVLFLQQLILTKFVDSLLTRTTPQILENSVTEDDTAVVTNISMTSRRQTGRDEVQIKRNGTTYSSLRPDKILKSTGNALIVTRKEYLKKDWCKSEPLVQRIQEDRCLSRTIINKFCYGQCNSFYIPKSPKKRRDSSKKRPSNNTEFFEDEDLTEPLFISCAMCRPKKFVWITITLRCPGLVPQFRKKRIQRIKQCKCVAESHT